MSNEISTDEDRECLMKNAPRSDKLLDGADGACYKERIMVITR